MQIDGLQFCHNLIMHKARQCLDLIWVLRDDADAGLIDIEHLRGIAVALRRIGLGVGAYWW